MNSLMLLAIIGLIGMLVLMFMGMNIGLSMFLVGFVGYACVMNWNWAAAFAMLRTNTVSNAMNYTMSVVPLFVLMGQFAFRSGISNDLFRSTRKLFGRVPGGLAYTGVISCALFGAICGSLGATTATMCSVAKPIMRENEYDDALIGGTLSCGGTLGTLIPPSTPFILYGIMASTSIGSLFAAGVVPGILMAICFCAVIAIWTKIHPNAAPGSRSYTMKEKLQALKGFVPMVLLFGIVLGGMFTGYFSVTECAAVGAAVAFIFMVIRRQATWANIKASLIETVESMGMAMIILAGANILGCFLSITNLPNNLANWVNSLTVPHVMIIAVIILIYAFLGCIMDTLAAVVLTVPIFLPIIKSFGYDPIWFGVIIVMVMNMGAVTPPVGISCYVAAGTMKDIPLTTVFKGALPFLLSFLVAFIIIVAFPQLSLWLPSITAH